MYAISDLSSLYENQLAKVNRGVAVVDQKFVVIRDELVAMNKPTTIRWTMMTPASPEVGKDRITLQKEGHQLVVQVINPANVQMKTWSADPTTNFDAPNPGKILIGFEFDLQPDQKQTIEVLLIPGSVNEEKVKFDKPLDKWKK
jgi:hypothetical protein